MSNLSDFLIDHVPGPIYRLGYWIKTRPKHIKWWFQRANGKLPECDCWEYKETLAENLTAGLEYLLRGDSHVDWDADGYHRQAHKEMKIILSWLKEYKENEVDNVLFVREGESPKGVGFKCMTPQEYKEYEERRKEAFRLLGEIFPALWD